MAMKHQQILQALLGTGITQEELAAALNTTQPTIARWLKHQEPKYQSMLAIIDLAKDRGLVSEDYDIQQPKIDAVAINEVPEVYLTGGLGGGGIVASETQSENGMSFAKDVIRDHWRLPSWIFSKLNVSYKNMAAFPVQGDSMEPTIENGDVIFIDTNHRIPSPPGIYALADEFGGVIVKRVEVVSKPSDEFITVRISSDNPRHSSRELTLSEIQIIGRYVGRFTF